MDSNPAGEKQRVRICLSYDGTDFFGWQRQSQQTPTVQETLENPLSRICNQEVALVGSGRTDRGVHALNQWAHADLPTDGDYTELRYKLERMTPSSIAIKKVEVAPEDFHAQISAEQKRYVYRFFARPLANPLIHRYSWHYRDSLNMNFLQEASKALLGDHDFSSFQSTGTAVSTPIRTIHRCQWQTRPSGFVDFHIVGNGFLKQMVRNIVGTLMWLHEKQASPEDFHDILEAKDRKAAGPPAPPQGLFLAQVKYPSELDNKCRKL